MEKNLKGLKVISLVGPQGSGKSTLGTALANYIKTEHLETSSVVKSTLDYEMDRDSLYQTGILTKDNPDWLGEAIGKRIFTSDVKKRTYVLSGVREIEVHKSLRRQGARLYVFAIATDPTLRFNRLKDLGKVSDARHFLEKELNERKLGLPNVVDEAKYTIETSTETDPREIAKRIHGALLGKGIKCN